MGISDVAFLGHCICADDSMIELSKDIKNALFNTEIKKETSSIVIGRKEYNETK